MNAKQERALMGALTKTLHAYENLISNPKKYAPKWEGYGSADTCRICKVLRVAQWGYPGCSECPLYSCDTWTQLSLEDALNRFRYEDFSKEVKRAAKARYNWLLRKLTKGGYVYE